MPTEIQDRRSSNTPEEWSLTSRSGDRVSPQRSPASPPRRRNSQAQLLRSDSRRGPSIAGALPVTAEQSPVTLVFGYYATLFHGAGDLDMLEQGLVRQGSTCGTERLQRVTDETVTVRRLSKTGSSVSLTRRKSSLQMTSSSGGSPRRSRRNVQHDSKS